jgi:hypothetical protein
MDRIDLALGSDSDLPELSRGALLFGEGVGSSLGRMLVDRGVRVSKGALKGPI